LGPKIRDTGDPFFPHHWAVSSGYKVSTKMLEPAGKTAKGAVPAIMAGCCAFLTLKENKNDYQF
jgi:hypothetical protein